MSIQPIKAVLFDLDGTLLDRDASLLQFVEVQYNKYEQLQHIDRLTYIERFIALDQHGYVWKDKVYTSLIAQFSISGITAEELLEDYVTNFQHYCIGFANLLPTLSSLKQNNIKLGLISNGYGQFQYDNFNALGIAHLFDAVLISEWEQLRKPDPAIFRRALEKLAVTAEQSLFVGDHPINDIQASRAAGMRTAWKSNDQFDNVDADIIIDNLSELVDFVINKP